MLVPFALLASHIAFAPKVAETPLAVAKKLAMEYEASMRRLDASWLAKHSTPSMVFSSVNEGDQDRDGMIVRLSAVYARIKEVKQASMKVVTATLIPEGLRIVTDTRMSFMVPSNNGVVRHIELKTREQSLWTKRQGTWMVTRIKQVKDDSTIDGRPLLFGLG